MLRRSGACSLPQGPTPSGSAQTSTSGSWTQRYLLPSSPPYPPHPPLSPNLIFSFVELWGDTWMRGTFEHDQFHQARQQYHLELLCGYLFFLPFLFPSLPLSLSPSLPLSLSPSSHSPTLPLPTLPTLPLSLSPSLPPSPSNSIFDSAYIKRYECGQWQVMNYGCCRGTMERYAPPLLVTPSLLFSPLLSSPLLFSSLFNFSC